MEKHELYKLVNPDGRLMHQGVNDGCYYKLQGLQGHSADLALKQGWRIDLLKDLSEDEYNNIVNNDPYLEIEVVVAKEFSHRDRFIDVTYNGIAKQALLNACRFNGNTVGSKVWVPRKHLLIKE